MENFAMGYYKICLWITRLIYLNILWIIFSLLGLLILGIMPATVSMFAVIRKWVMGETEISIFGVFWNSYKKEFLKSNLLGLVLIVSGYFLYIELQFMRAQEGLFNQFISFAIIGLFILYFIILMYVLPLFSHFEVKTLQYVKWALVIGIAHPILTILMGGGIAIFYYLVISYVPGISLLFLGSVSAFILMWGSIKTFHHIEVEMTNISENQA